MNRDLQKLLQEKWFLVAADFIAVLGVLCLGLDPKDGFQAFLAVLGILGASLIVVIPVLRDGGGKAERLAEQARLRAALAAEIDRLRDDARAAAEASNRRIGEVELDIRRQAEAAAAAVAQRASTEINALKAEVAALKATAAELEKKVAVAQRSAAVGTEAKESLDDLGAKLESLAETVRSGLATTEETAEVLAELKAAAPAVTAEDLKAVRDEVKKAAQKAAQSADKLDARLDAVSAELQALRDRPVGAPAAPITEDGDED
jgi:di/tripeptidase